MAERLTQAFTAAGKNVILTREPGGTALGEQIRTVLLSDESMAMLPQTEVLLFAAARAQLVGEVIRPALERGSVVITDRFVDSSMAYQWGGRELDRDAVWAVQAMATGGLEPDIKILLDLPVETALRRRHADLSEVNRLDNEVRQFHARVHDAYHSLADADPARWCIVDASRPVDLVWSDVLRAVNLNAPVTDNARRMQ